MSEVQVDVQSPSREEWEIISRRLQEPFEPRDVDFRVQGRANDQTGRAQVVAYVDARVVQDRLDAVVGAGNWAFDWTPLVIDNGEVMVAKGTLTVYGVSKSDAGSASNFEQSLGAVSHCFKRAAVHWGIGRYLYNLPMNWVTVEKGGRIPEQLLRELRAKLPRPEASAQRAEVVEDRGLLRPLAQGSSSGAAADVRGQARQVGDAGRSGQNTAVSTDAAATEKQLASIRKLCEALNKPTPEGELSYARARELLSQLSGEYQQSRRAS